MNRLGVHGCSVVTAITAQSTQEVLNVEPVSPEMLDDQFRALRDDLIPRAIKIGMLGTGTTVSMVANTLNDLSAFVVCDPVLSASRTGRLLDSEGLARLKDDLFPRINLLTPNISEAECLLGRGLHTDSDIELAASEICSMGPASVLLKGGHREGAFAQDFWTDGNQSIWLTADRIPGPGGHGTGCVLSSAIASCIALGMEELDSLVVAKAYVHQGLRLKKRIGGGDSPVLPSDWPSNSADFPWLTNTAAQGRERPEFPPAEPLPLGIYPIVDRLDPLKELLPLGLRILQLRIKDSATPGLEAILAEAICLARKANVPLYINDHWRIALRHGAFGVHLGQDDLSSEAIESIHASGARLGISTHSYAELARAMSIRPSYVAIGTLFHTTSKAMDYPPLGLETLTRLRKLIDIPIVAIGGIHLDRANEVRQAGADGMAVISEIGASTDVSATLRAWKEFYGWEGSPVGFQQTSA